jgi:hypothetical protein
VKKRKESPESTYSSTYKLKKNSSTRIPPVIEFDKLSFRNAPQPTLTHDGPYDGALKIGAPGRERNMFPDHNPDPHLNPKHPLSYLLTIHRIPSRSLMATTT